MVSKTLTMNLGWSKNEICPIVGTIFAPKKLTFFSMIAAEPVEIVFYKKIDNKKEVNRNYVMP